MKMIFVVMENEKMIDLIDRQEAIKALCKAGCDSGHCGVSCDDVKAIEDLPPSQQWIPTHDRKPDLNQKVIWQFDYRDGHEYLIGSRNDVMLLADSAVAWMPLPEPYKGGNNGSARWEYVDYGGIGNWHCSACRAISPKKYNFCPACGRDMRGDYQ